MSDPRDRRAGEPEASPRPVDLPPNEGTYVSSALARAARRAADHFGAAEVRDDPIELWGRRIGRALSLAAVVALGLYLYLTYIR